MPRHSLTCSLCSLEVSFTVPTVPWYSTVHETVPYLRADPSRIRQNKNARHVMTVGSKTRTALNAEPIFGGTPGIV